MFLLLRISQHSSLASLVKPVKPSSKIQVSLSQFLEKVPKKGFLMGVERLYGSLGWVYANARGVICVTLYVGWEWWGSFRKTKQCLLMPSLVPASMIGITRGEGTVLAPRISGTWAYRGMLLERRLLDALRMRRRLCSFLHSWETTGRCGSVKSMWDASSLGAASVRWKAPEEHSRWQ